MAETIGLPKNAGKENVVNPLTGFLSKAVDTAAEIYLVREGAKAGSQRAIGTVAPTGQTDPARTESAKETASEPETPSERKRENGNNLPLIIGVSIGAAIVVALLVNKRGKK